MTELLTTNLSNDEHASVQIVVDEIWSSYDVDQNGVINKSEARDFVQTYMPDFQPGFQYTDQTFEALFSQIDSDGSGELDKKEMAAFVIKVIKEGNTFGLPEQRQDHQFQYINTEENMALDKTLNLEIMAPIIPGQNKFLSHRKLTEKAGKLNSKSGCIIF